MQKKYFKFVYLLFGIFLTGAATTNAASLYFSPSSGNFSADQSFTVGVYAESTDQALNAASGVVTFPIDKLQAVSISKSGSVFNLWAQEPSFSNSDGTLNFEGVVLNPGFIGSSGKIISITFRPRSTGQAQLKFSSGSILANDGKGTNILTGLREGQYTLSSSGGQRTIPSPKINSTTHPDESRWYNSNIADFSWNLPESVDGVNYALSTNSEFSLPQQNKGLISTTSFDLTKQNEGILYFYLRFRTQDGWGQTKTKQIRVDYSAPSAPEVTRKLGDDEPTNPQPEFGIHSTDAVSGIAFYKIRLDDGAWINPATSTDGYYLVPAQIPQEHKLEVRAYDRAGNFADSVTGFIVKTIGAPRIISYTESIDAGEPFTIEGDALPLITIKINLKKSGEIVEFFTKADEQGKWSAQYEDSLPSGMWELTAYAIDQRGAISQPTQKLSLHVGNLQDTIFNKLADWGGFGIFAILIISGLLAAFFFALFRIRTYRLDLRKRLFKIKGELKKDLKDFERELLMSKEKGKNIDLSPSKLKEQESKLKKEIEHIEEDIRKDIEEIDKMN